MSGVLTLTTYYLRIQTKDIAGNWSIATTVFIFKYDPTLPTNPGTCSAWTDNAKTTPISSDTWQHIDANPYFEWSDATAGSGVEGYTVYWGTSITGEPGTGSIQVDTSYATASSVPSGSIYYLRLRTKDNDGNWSSAATLFTFKYDATSPTNPGTCTAWADSSKAGTISSNTWQKIDDTPYFEWSGAMDPVSGVAGYAVYWGISSTGDPGTDAIQTQANYTVNTSVGSQATYYLRVRTKDNVGNWSEPETLFIFRYNVSGLPPAPEKLTAYPNPYYMTGNGIIFTAICPGAELKIYTISGELVRVLHNDNNNGEITWDAKNEDKSIVASGIYMYVTKSSSGRNVQGKVGVVR